MTPAQEEFKPINDREVTHGVSGKYTWVQRANRIKPTTTYTKVKQYSDTMPGDRT